MTELLQGNVACARAAIDSGCTFFAGYPITPSSEIAEHLAAELPKHGGIFVQMEDEMASLGAVIGASLAGRKAMTATSGPGFSLMQEHIGYAAYAEIPCVIVDVMRGGPSTGLPTRPSQGDVMQARWGTHGDRPAIALAPASVAEVYELTASAFALAERYRTPVILLYDEVIGHLRERAEIVPALPVERARPSVPPEAYRPYGASPDDVPPLADIGSGYRFHVTGLGHDERGYPTDDPTVTGALAERLARKIDRARDEVASVETYRVDDADRVIVAYGIVARAARRAVDEARERGVRLGLFRPRTLWPFPERALRDVAARRLLVAEMNLGQIALEVERCAGGSEIERFLRADGRPISPTDLLGAMGAA